MAPKVRSYISTWTLGEMASHPRRPEGLTGDLMSQEVYFGCVLLFRFIIPFPSVSKLK